MSKIVIFSDPHLGVNRLSHTTPDSRERMAQQAISQIEKVVVASNGHPIVCVGDLFDKPRVSNKLLLDAYAMTDAVDYCIAGNHDLSNNSAEVSSFSLLSEFAPSLISNEVGLIATEEREFGDVTMTLVPHHSSQELFDKALSQVMGHKGKRDLLFLHCTYDFALAEGSDTALNLTPSQADELLEKYNYIFIGHEHAPALHRGGRVIMAGSTMPFSMGEICDRYVWTYDSETEEVTKELLWDASEQSTSVKYQTEGDIPDMRGVQFVDVIGSCRPEDGPDLTAYIASIWESGSDLLQLRNNVDVISDVQFSKADNSVLLDDLNKVIEEELKDSELLPYWRKYHVG